MQDGGLAEDAVERESVSLELRFRRGNDGAHTPYKRKTPYTIATTAIAGYRKNALLMGAVKAAIVLDRVDKPGQESKTNARAGMPVEDFLRRGSESAEPFAEEGEERRSSFSCFKVRQPPLLKVCTRRRLDGPAGYIASFRSTSIAGESVFANAAVCQKSRWFDRTTRMDEEGYCPAKLSVC